MKQVSLILETPKQEKSADEVAEAVFYGDLTDGRIERLAPIIASRHMESVAEGHMNISFETITDLKDKHATDAKAFNRQIIRQWAQENPGVDQVQVCIVKYVFCLLYSICI